MPIETPEYLIGIGGGGSSVVERFMEKEWIIDEVVNPDVGASDPKLRARTIDSADSTSETNRRDTAAAEIQELIEAKKDEYGVGVGSVEVDFDHYNYVRDTEEGRTNEGPMTNRVDVNDLIDYADGLENCWWINASDDLLADGFGSGVNRRRALSKALYHVSSVHSTNPNDHPQQLGVGSGDTVAMVVALGGGTGSGSFIDMATDMADDANIHLFAVIPDAGHAGGQTESSDELASAYAALSELEYMAINNDSPFTTVTLLPYIEDSDIDDADFEEALVHTMLAFQNLWADSEAPAYLNPGMNNAINSYYTFNVAVPRVIEYDAGIRWKMQEDVNEYIETRREQLGVEQELYKTVENYLNNNFPDSFYATLLAVREGTDSDIGFDSTDESQVSAVQSMRRRLEEDLQGTLLADESLSVAGLPVEDIVSDIEEAYRNDYEIADGDAPVYDRIEDADTERVGYAEAIVERLPNQIKQYVSPGQFEEGSAQELAELVVREAENVEKRRNLLQAIYATDPGAVEGLDARDVDHIKRALTEVVLDPGARALAAEFPKNEVETLKNDLWGALCEAELQYVQYEEFETAVSQQLEDRIAEWWETAAASEFDVIANYIANREEIATLVADLDDACEDKATKLSDDTINVEDIRPQIETGRGESVDIQRLTDLLADVGLEDAIDENAIRTDIRNLIQARKAKDDAGGGILDIIGDDEEEKRQFNASVSKISDRFSVVYEEIDRPFKVEFEADFEETVLEELDRRYAEAVAAAVDSLEDLLTDAEGELERFDAATLVDEQAVLDRVSEEGSITRPRPYLDETGYVDITVPEDGSAVWDLFSSLETEIEGLATEDIDSVYDIKQALGVAEVIDTRTDRMVDDEEREDVVHDLLGLYLGPVREAKSALSADLQRLGSEYTDQGSDGLYLSVARLIRLANERAANEGDVDLAYPAEALGLDFTQTYEDQYTVQTTEATGQRTENVYRRIRPASTRDLAGDPDDIADSLIWDRQRENVVGEFVQSVRDIASGDPRFPVDLDALDPSEEGVSAQFQQLRIWNTYMSRAFEPTDADAAAEFDAIGGDNGEINRETLNKNRHEQNGYVSRRVGYGDEWTFSIVTFISGFTLDMLTPVTANGGYKETYENEQGEATYPWRNHSFGLEGNWARWSSLEDRLGGDGRPDWWPHGGAYVWRDETTDPGDISAWTLRVSGDELDTGEVTDRLNEMYAVEGFESTVEIDE